MADKINERQFSGFLADKSNMLLMFMALSYIIPILYAAKYYNKNDNLSYIVCDTNCKNVIVGGMVCLGIFAMLYEWERGCHISMGLIGWVLVGIYGLLLYDMPHPAHVVFAGITMTGIILFMMYHAWILDSPLFYFLVCIQILLVTEMAIHMDEDIFKVETGFFLNFAGYYLYLHTLIADIPIGTIDV